MNVRHSRFALIVFVASLALASSAICQTGISTAPVPPDPLELVVGNAQALTEPDQRAAALELLERAQQNYNFYAPHAPAFTLKVSFTSRGPLQHEGPGSMEEIYVGHEERWSADFDGTSEARVLNGAAWGSGGAIPLRVQMVRSAILWPLANAPARAMIRSANVNYNGMQLTCVLISGSVPEVPSPRQWVEREYCIDPETGLLHIWSEAPGIYTLYDYSSAIQFHGHTVAGRITVTEGGIPVLQIRVDSLADAGQVDPREFMPTPEMRAQGPSFLLAGPQREPLFVLAAAGGRATMIQPVIVHATISEDGKVVEEEALQNSPEALVEKALELVKNHKFAPSRRQAEVFVNVKFYLSQPAEGTSNSQ